MATPERFQMAVPEGAAPPTLADFLGAAPVAALLADRDGRVVGWNDAACQVLGASPEDLRAAGPVDLRNSLRTTRQVLAAEFDKVIQGAVVEIPEFFLRLGPDTLGTFPSARLARGFWAWARAFPIADADGSTRWIGILFDDITERKELERILVRAQKMEAIGTLAGGLAHDLNNTLSGVVGYASLLAARLPAGPDRDAAATILDAADQAATLTGQLMTIARRSTPMLASLDVAELLRHAASYLGRSLGPRYGIDLDVAVDLARVDADRPQLEQALTNLAMNARDAMPEGGTIAIRATNRRFGAKDRPPLPVMPGGDYVEIEVSDSGAGMSADLAERVFEPFFAVRETGPGTGLGLAITYGIVKSHCGFILVRSAPGQGSSFTIFLPRGRLKPQAKPRAASREPPEKVAGPLSVLVIDDEPLVRRVEADMLARLGHRAEECDGMDSAMERILRDRSRFDVLLVDVIMPEKSGLDLVRALREADFDIPAILCTGYASPEVQADVRHLAATTILPKPFDVEALDAALARALASSG